MPEESLVAYRMRLDAVLALTYTLAVLAVGAKLWSKKIRVGWARVWWDGYLAVFTLLLATGLLVVNVVGLRPSAGKHHGPAPGDATDEDFLYFAKWALALVLVHLACITFTKFTTLAMYWKLLTLSSQYIIPTVGTAILIWWLVMTPLLIFSCGNPQNRFVIIRPGGPYPSRLDGVALFLGVAIPNTIFDITIVCMPLRIVLNLRMPPGQRVILAAMFALGAFICFISVVRVVILLQMPRDDILYNQREYLIWTTVEVNIGLVCSCLPGTRPLLIQLGLGKLFPSVPGAEQPNDMPTVQTIGTRRNRIKIRTSVITAFSGASPQRDVGDGFQMMDVESTPRPDKGTEQRDSFDTGEV